MKKINSSNKTAKALNLFARNAGKPELDLAILAEGNAATFDQKNNRFLVKASGVFMSNCKDSDWVWLDLFDCIEVIEQAHRGGITQKLIARLNEILHAGKTISGEKKKASIETLVHAVAFKLLDATWSLHTHPTAVVSLASNKNGAAYYEASIFPDETVLCGPKPLFLPFAEPGLDLGLGFYRGIKKFQSQNGYNPGQIILGNHGLCTAGKGAEETFAMTLMSVKAARVRINSLSTGGKLNFISNQMANQIAFRPDEVARRAKLVNENK